MAIAFRSSTVKVVNPANATLVQDVPTGVQDGDMLVWILAGDVNGTDFTTPSGWTALVLGTQCNTMNVKAMYRVASSEPATYTIVGGETKDVGYMFCFDPSGGTVEYDDHVMTIDNNAVATITSGTVTADADGAAAAVFFHDGGAVTISSPPASMTLINSGPNNAAAFSGAGYYQTGMSGDFTKAITWSGSDQLAVVIVTVSAPGGGASPVGPLVGGKLVGGILTGRRLAA